MRINKWKLLICFIICLILFEHTVYADEIIVEEIYEDIHTDGSQSAASWFHVFEKFLDNKALNGLKFFMLVDSLRQPIYQDQIGLALNSDIERKNMLSEYGLTENSIYQIVSYFLSTFPENMGKVGCCSKGNIYADLYNEDQIVYSEYMNRFHEYLNELFRQLPIEMRTPITKYDRLNAGEIVVFQGLMNIVIRDYIAFEVFNMSTATVQSRQVTLRDSVRNRIEDELIRVANTYPLDYSGDKSVDLNEISNYADAFMGLGNVILMSLQFNFETNNQMDNAFDLAELANLLVRSEVYDTESPPNPVTLVTNTDFIELDSSTPLTNGYINEFKLIVSTTGTSSPIVFIVDDETVANVNSDGLVTLSTSKQGFTKITVSIEGTNVYKEVNVQVSEQSPKGDISFYGPYISGYPDRTFRVDNIITRAEIATMFVRVLRLDVNENNIPLYSNLSFSEPSFNDVSRDYWAYQYIEIALKEGLMGGYDGDKFSPNSPVSRAEIATIISNAWLKLGIESNDLSKHLIIDVEPDHWAFQSINKVYNANIVEGYLDGTYKPDAFTTRGEIVIMINRVINRPEFKPAINSFDDIKNNHWAYGFIEAATRIQVKKDVEFDN